jgi:DNA-binding response OmpR family regulator
MHHLLLIDDDVELTDMLSAYLGREGFTLTVSHDGAEASAMLADPTIVPPDLVVLDVMLPTLDGFGVLRALRDRSQSPPVLMLTARGDDDDRIAGLELGADDYLSKPFNPRELVARLRAILRRVGETPEQGTLTVGELVLDPSRIEARLQGQTISLTGAEFRVLQMLVQQVGRVVSRAELTDHALGRKLELYDRSIDTHVSNLRRKLNLTEQSGLEIRGVRGVGYQMTRPTDN